MTLERRRDGVGQSLDRLFPSILIREDRELGVQEVVGLGYGNRHA